MRFIPSFNSPKDILITGGLGFIGSNLALSLLNSDNYCTIVDSLNPNYGGNFKNISPEEKNHKLKINISDVRDMHSLKYLLSNVKILFNLAGQTSHVDSMNDPFTDLEINARAQLSLLEVCREVAPNTRIVFASTRQIYGRPEYLPVDEKHPLRPVDTNGINKLAGEQYHILYSKVYGINSTVLRLTNTYGPRMRIKDARQTFLGVWIKRLIEKQIFEVWGGEQLRDYTYVDDCIEALQLAATNKIAIGEIYNIGGSGSPISLLETAETLVEVAREMSLNILDDPFELKEYPQERKNIDIGNYYANNQKIKTDLGWEPSTSLRDGIRKTLSYYIDNLSYYL